MSTKNAYNPHDLVMHLKSWLAEIWPDFTAFADILPEPDATRPFYRSPFFLVQTTNGVYSPQIATAQIRIVLGVMSDAKVEGKDCEWAVGTLMNAVDALCVKLYNKPDGLLFGCLPGQLSWSLYQSDLRPVYQAQIEIPFELPHAAHDNAGFLI